MEFVSAGLARVEVSVSTVLTTSLPMCWNLAREFGKNRFLAKANGFDFRIISAGGGKGTEVGSTRVFMIGNAQLFEQLTALDDTDHILRWICLSHPQTISPFHSASFVNYQASLHMRTVTVGNQTYAEWKGDFYTEPQYARYMHATLESWYLAGFKALQACSTKLQTMATLSRQASHPCGVNLKAGPEFPKDRSTWTMPQQVNNPAHAAAMAGNHNPSAAVMDSYLVNDQYFAGTSAQPVGAPSPHDSGSSDSDQANKGHATSSSQAFQAAQAALGQPGRRHRVPIQAGRNQLASVSESDKVPSSQSSRPSTFGFSSQVETSTGPSGPSDGSRSTNSGPKARNSHSVDRSEADLRRAEAQRQYGSFDMPVNLAQHDQPGDQLREQLREQLRVQQAKEAVAAKEAALKSDHSSQADHSLLSRDPTSSRSSSWESDKATCQEFAPQAHAGQPSSAGSSAGPSHAKDSSKLCQERRREDAIVMTDAEAEIMGTVNYNLAAQRGQHQHSRSSFEEEAAALSARHAALHQKRLATAGKSAQASPFASPFAKPQEPTQQTGGPFAAQTTQGPFGAASGAQTSGGNAPPRMGVYNPFAAVQQGGGRIGG